MKNCKEVMNNIETQLPNAYCYKLMRDPGVTGRFEVTVYATKEDLESGQNGELMHSKQNTKTFPKGKEFYDAVVAKAQK